MTDWRSGRSSRQKNRAWPLVALVLAGCGPSKPVLLDRPADWPVACGARKLFNSPDAYIYARDEADVAEAAGWVKETRDYINRKYRAELGKGLVLVQSPGDAPVVSTLEQELALERDPANVVTPMRHPQSAAELRNRLAAEGVPEGPTVRGATVPLPPDKLAALGLRLPPLPWAVAAPSHALAVGCAVEVGTAAFRKKRPDLSEEQARKLADLTKNTLAKSFEIGRGDVVFILWAQQQKGWSDDQRREAILSKLRQTFRSNWLPVPTDEALGW